MIDRLPVLELPDGSTVLRTPPRRLASAPPNGTRDIGDDAIVRTGDRHILVQASQRGPGLLRYRIRFRVRGHGDGPSLPVWVRTSELDADTPATLALFALQHGPAGVALLSRLTGPVRPTPLADALPAAAAALGEGA